MVHFINYLCFTREENLRKLWKLFFLVNQMGKHAVTNRDLVWRLRKREVTEDIYHGMDEITHENMKCSLLVCDGWWLLSWKAGRLLHLREGHRFRGDMAIVYAVYNNDIATLANHLRKGRSDVLSLHGTVNRWAVRLSH